MSQAPQTQTTRAINFVLMARFHTHVAVKDLRDALNRLKGRHHAFDLRNMRDFYDPHAPETGPYSLEILPNCTAKDWESAAAQQLARPFDLNGSRVRFALLQQPQADDLLIVCDHNGSDGLSATLLLQDLLELLNHPERQLPPLPIPPPIWEALPTAITQSFSGRVRSMLLTAAIHLMNWDQRRKKSNPVVPSFQVVHYEFTADWTALFVERCRTEGVSVHAAVCAAWLFALPRQAGKASSRKKISSPVSLRKHLKPELRDCAGMFYTTVVTGVECSPDSRFWDVARDVKQQMRRAESKRSFYTKPLFLQALSKQMHRQADNAAFQMPELPIDYDYSVTNLGRVQNDYIYSEFQEARYSIEALYGPMVNAFRGEKTIGACTLGGQLRFVFTTFTDEIDTNAAQDWIDRVGMILQNAAV